MNKTLQLTALSLLTAGSLLLVACNDAQSSEQNVAKVTVCTTCGVVKSVKRVSTRPQGSGMGAAAGAVVGGLAGSQIGGGNGKTLATVAGLVGGAVVGNNIERNRNTEHYYEVVVAMDTGESRTMRIPNASGLEVGSNVTVDAGEVHLR